MKKVTLLKKYCLVGLAGIIAASAIGCTSEDINLDKDGVADDASLEESSESFHIYHSMKNYLNS